MSSENDVPVNQPIRLPMAPAAPEWEPTEIAEAAAVAVAGSGEKPAQPLDVEAVRPLVVDALKTVYDPEIPVDIYELGLIYRIEVDDDRNIEVDMTLTAPGCPVAGEMPGWVEDAVREVPGVRNVKVDLVFDPPWDPSRMSDEAKLQLNMF